MDRGMDDKEKRGECSGRFGLPNWAALKNFHVRVQQLVSLPEFMAFAPGHATTKPTCDSSRRDAIMVTRGGAGVADILYICTKDAANAYAWQPFGGGASGPAPTGAIVAYAASSAPLGWLLCDGTAVSRTTYAALFALISTTYGAGDGSTTFNVPNLKSRFPVGLDSADTALDALGETGGAKTVTLTAAESGVPAHSHGVGTYAAANESSHTHGSGSYAVGTDASHDHLFGRQTNTSTGGAGDRLSNVTGTDVTESGGSHNHTFSGTSAAGSSHTHSLSGSSANNSTAAASSAHTNMPPFIALNWVIKY